MPTNTLKDARSIVEDTHRSGRTNVRDVDQTMVGKFVICLTRNHYGYYVPSLARLVGFTTSGRVRVDMYGHGIETRTVTRQAVFRDDTCHHYDIHGNRR